jgi:Tfp pilus assembly protein PilO
MNMNFDFNFVEIIVTLAVSVTANYFLLKGKIDRLELLYDLQTATIKEFRSKIERLTSKVEELETIREYEKQQKKDNSLH